jgi:AcrR family transcriptional regulator
MLGAPQNAVAKLAGARIGTLHHYFSNKDGLLGALIARNICRFVEEVEAPSVVATGRGALDGIIQATVRHQMCRPHWRGCSITWKLVCRSMPTHRS